MCGMGAGSAAYVLWMAEHESATPDGSLREVHRALQVCAHQPWRCG